VIAFNSQRSGLNTWGLFRRLADGSGQEEALVEADGNTASPSWSPNGRYLVYSHDAPATGDDLWVLPTAGDRKPIEFLRTRFDESEPTFSPDGRWIAYRSNSTGRDEVYVRAFPAVGGEFRISRDGGWAPRWRSDGQELFFLAHDGTMMVADVEASPTFRATVPRSLFSAGLLRSSPIRPYAVSSDGSRFLIPVTETRQPMPITVVLNWPSKRGN
jgi:serine/threonine-protein kinase